MKGIFFKIISRIKRNILKNNIYYIIISKNGL
jgi:hypothetical protein